MFLYSTASGPTLDPHSILSGVSSPALNFKRRGQSWALSSLFANFMFVEPVSLLNKESELGYF